MIEDDLGVGQGTMLALKGQQAEVVWVRQLGAATKLLARESFDAIVLDLNLPDGDGIDWLTLHRSRKLTLPVLVLSARDALHHRLRGLDSGADDYLVKPFSLDELVSRLRALVRRAHGFSQGELRGRGITLNPDAMTAHVRGEPVSLSPTEYKLLLKLLRQLGRVVTRMQLEEGALLGSDSVSLDMHMSNLRRKLGAGIIRTIRGVGYAIDDEGGAHAHE